MINQSYVDFFQKLEKNNNTEWFRANKKTYESAVKKPFTELIGELIPALQKLDADIPDLPKDIILRINRDIRFSKDKTPYNTMLKANFTPGGRKSPNPGFYLGIGAKTLHVGGGLYHPSPKDLKKIREYMINHQEEAKVVFEDSTCLKTFGSIRGEQAKRLDKELASKLEEMPLLANKQFFYMAEYPVQTVLPDDQISFISRHFQMASSFHHFFKKALN